MNNENERTRWRAIFDTDGYIVISKLFSDSETGSLRDHYMHLRSSGTYRYDSAGIDIGGDDPLKAYPRMIHMHRWDETSLAWLIDRRIDEVITTLTGESPYAVQTMLYFKPAGARGQALHQDQAYLKVEPGTCIAAWMALDDCDEENGCLQVVPGTHTTPLLCTEEADTTQSFTGVTVPLPGDRQPVPVRMRAGDILFFNGQLIHGSFPNTSADRFRRSLIGHYALGEARRIARFYHPVLRMDGSEVIFGVSEGGGPCGMWVEKGGNAVVEMVAG